MSTALFSSSRTRFVGGLCVALLFVFLVAGTFGRDPWKADEPYSMGMVLNFFRGHDLIVPRVASDPFVEKPPLMYWSGAITARLTHRVLPLFAGAQLAVLGWVALALACIGHLARRLYRPGSEATSGSSYNIGGHWLAPALMVGSVGTIEHVHKLTADVPQMTGAALALLALARLARPEGHTYLWGALLGTAAGLAFLSKGLLVPGVLMLTCLAVMLVPAYRTRRYAVGLGWALLASLPWMLIWPTLFWHASHPLFIEWFWDNNFGRFFGFVNLGGEPHVFSQDLTELMTLSFPAGWLAIGALVSQLRGGGLRAFITTRPELAMLWLYVLIFLGTLLSSSTTRNIYMMPMFPALGVLGAGVRLPRWLEQVWGSVAILLMSVVGVWLWVRWGLLLSGHGNVGAGPIGKWLTLDYPLAFSLTNVIFALAVAALWVAAIVRRRELGALMLGFAGLTFVWGTLAILLMPWINDARSYRAPFLSLQAALPATAADPARACVGTIGFGESERAMLDYFIGIRPVQLKDISVASQCDVLLLLDKRAKRLPAPKGWRALWEGGRPGDQNERVRAYAAPNAAPASAR